MSHFLRWEGGSGRGQVGVGEGGGRVGVGGGGQRGGGGSDVYDKGSHFLVSLFGVGGWRGSGWCG